MIYSLNIPFTSQVLIEFEDLPEGLTKEDLIKMVNDDVLEDAMLCPFTTAKGETNVLSTLSNNTNAIEFDCYD